MPAPAADIGLIGLAVMGENLVLNMESHGYTVAVYNRTAARVDEFLAGRAKGKRVQGHHSVKELVAALKRPRKVMMMVKAGPAAWPHVKPIFQAIAAKAPDGTPCCDWVGNEGAGHYVKMVHNGIEYGDMQLIGESYHLLSGLAGLDADALHEVFARWNKGPLDSYLIEITRDIFGYRDPETGKPLVDLILDAAGQKGTGKWMVGSATELGVPLTLITEAVFARCLSAQKEERVAASKLLS